MTLGMHGNRRPTPEAVLPDRLPTPGEMHDEPHEHSAEDEVRDPMHVTYHRTHPGYGHYHAHMPGFDHHPPQP